MNLKLPRNLQIFLNDFQGDFFSSLPNPLDADDKKLGCTPKSKFHEVQMSCSIIVNSGQFIVFVFAILILKGLIFGALLISPKNGKFEWLMKKINQKFGAGFLIDLLFGYQLDYMLSIVIELSSWMTK